MKGFVEIELKNTKTGEKKIVKGENMFTNALDSIFNGCPYGLKDLNISGVPSYYNYGDISQTPLYTIGLGGILLYEKFDTGDSVDDYYEGPKNPLIATASVDNPTTTDARVGMFVSSDSGDIINEATGQRGYKWVYEWFENNGNGTIGAIGLSNHRAWNYYAGTAETTLALPYIGFYRNINISNIKAANKHYIVTKVPDQAYATIYHVENDSLFLGGTAVSIPSCPNITVTPQNLDAAFEPCFDGDDLYFVKAPINTKTGAAIIIKIDPKTGEELDRISISIDISAYSTLDNILGTTDYMTSSDWDAGWRKRVLIHNGYLYTQMGNQANSTKCTGVIRFNISDPTDIEVYKLPVAFQYYGGYFILAHDGKRIHLMGNSNGGGYAADCILIDEPDGDWQETNPTFHDYRPDNNTMRYAGILYRDGVWCVGTKSNINSTNSDFGAAILTPYLATKFTLPEPLEKDNTQTMRIIYTVWED